MMYKKKNLGEVRGLKTGSYYSADGSAVLNISRRDNGVIVELGDFDADIYYEFVIDGDDAVFSFGELVHPPERRKEEEI